MDKFVCLLFLAWLMASCASVQQTQADKHDCSAQGDKRALAGSWLYEAQGYISTLILDEQGHGSDEWNEVQLDTLCLDRQRWHGVWRKAGKEDRFDIGLSSDLKEGKGHWLDIDGKPQGEFQVKRIGSGKAR